MTLDEVAGKIQKAKAGRVLGCPAFRGCCPAHEDHSPSFAVWESADGWLHFKCQKGCDEGSILTALGMEPKDRKVYLNGAAQAPRETVYTYTDAAGNYLFEKVRLYKDGKKTFRQRIQDGADYVYTLAALGERAKTLYRLPDVIEAISKGETVYVNEGEKACDAFRARGLCATCQPGGAQEGRPESKWLPQHTAALKGATCVVVADRDPVGIEYARYVAKQLGGAPIVQSKTDGDKHDAYDHFAAGLGAEDFVPLAEKEDALPCGKVFSNDAFEPVDLEYLWEPRMPIGKIILWDADGGTQKTTLLAAIAAGLSIGQLPNGDGECEVVRTAYFHKGEDDDDEIATVFHANGGNFENIVFYNLPHLNLNPEGLGVVEKIIRKGGFQHVVFDALFYFCQHLKAEGWKDPMAPLPILEGLKDVARSTRACISDLRHTSKGKADKEASEMGFGSVQFRNSHRGQMVMRYHPKPQNELEHGLVVVTDEKGSLLAPRAPAFAFKRKGNRIEYVADFDNPFDARDTASNRKGRREIYGRWLTSLLENGPVPLKDVMQQAKEKGIPRRTLYRVFEDIRGFSETRGFGENCRAIWHLNQPEELEFDPFADD